MSIPSQSGASGQERLIWLKYYIVLKRQITFNLGWNADKSTKSNFQLQIIISSQDIKNFIDVLSKNCSVEISDETQNGNKFFHKQGEFDESCPIHYTHLAGYPLSVFHIWRYFCSLLAKNKTKHELILIHLAYILLFSYFCVACENSEFCYDIFLHNSFHSFMWELLHGRILSREHMWACTSPHHTAPHRTKLPRGTSVDSPKKQRHMVQTCSCRA